MSLVADLQRLAGLHREGLLTDVEHNEAKRLVLTWSVALPAAVGETSSPRGTDQKNAVPTPDTCQRPVGQKPSQEEREHPVLGTILVALLYLGVVAFVVVLKQLGDARGPDPAAERVEVVVAAEELPCGLLLTPDRLRTAITRKSLLKDSLPPAFVEEREELIGKRLTRTIRAGQPFHKLDVSEDPFAR